MAGIIVELRSDHSRMTKLLDALERQIDCFSEGGLLDFDIVDGIQHYCEVYPDLHHHPREDLIFDQLKLRAPQVVASIGDLRSEHRKLAELSARFTHALTAVEQDVPMERHDFTHAARAFLSAYRQHIMMEEKHFFPAAENSLTAADWRALTAQLGAIDDPLFDGHKDERFDALYRDIIAWDKNLPAGA